MNIKNNRLSLIIKAILWLSIPMILVGFFVLSGERVQADQAGSKTYTIKSTSTPYKNQYKTAKTYNDKTKQYYTLRSYLEQLEQEGGGTLVLSKGTYTITNTLYVSSNVTLRLKDGVKLVKGNSTGTTGLAPTKSLFQLIAPSKSKKSAIVGKYDGENAINIIGEGTALIDLNYIKDAVGIVIGHNSDISIEGITFQKMNGQSFIKIGASKNITLSDNVFRYHKDSETNSKEAVALEIPDAITKGFIYTWSKNDKTINLNITIENNKFSNLERAIGSSKYSQGKYQKNIRIINNEFSK
ncbi:MAG: glycoside hydrolase family protein, partial [Mobilitalea sp.]